MTFEEIYVKNLCTRNNIPVPSQEFIQAMVRSIEKYNTLLEKLA